VLLHCVCHFAAASACLLFAWRSMTGRPRPFYFLFWCPFSCTRDPPLVEKWGRRWGSHSLSLSPTPNDAQGLTWWLIPLTTKTALGESSPRPPTWPSIPKIQGKANKVKKLARKAPIARFCSSIPICRAATWATTTVHEGYTTRRYPAITSYLSAISLHNGLRSAVQSHKYWPGCGMAIQSARARFRC
jgi:hypothetical protein